MRAGLLTVAVALAGLVPAAAQGQGATAPPRGTMTSAGMQQAPTMPQMPQTPFLGGIPSGEPSGQPIGLTLSDAIDRGLKNNLGVLTTEQAVERARGSRWIALSQLLPNITSHLTESRQVINLQAFGFPSFPGVPSIIGPFTVFDARVFLSQSIFDLRALNDERAQSHDLEAARYSYKSARDLVVLVTANLYLEAVAASARNDVAKAQLQTAQALYTQAQDLKASGMIPAIGVLRAQVELATEQQRATAAQNDFDKAKLLLARVIGLPIGQPFTLSDEVPYAPMPEMTFDQALAQAYKARPDYQAALERVHAAEAERAAALGEALPSLHVNADYGGIGLGASPSNARETYTVVGALNIPIFQGGRTHGRLLETDAALRERHAEADDLKAGIYYDVRSAFLDLQANGEQVQVATRARDLAAQQLVQARDRFAAGVADNLEVVQAQEAVALANEQYIDGLYSFNMSKAALARALGIAEQAVRDYLGGAR